MAYEPEFPCDSDLKPLVEDGSLTAWHAMQITSSRDAARSRELLQSLQKKMDELTTPPQTKPEISIKPSYRPTRSG